MTPGQDALPDLEFKTATEWIRDDLKEHPAKGKPIREARRSAFARVPHGYLPSADTLIQQWFFKLYHEIVKDRGLRITVIENGDGKREHQYAEVVQLAFDDAYAGWLGRGILAQKDWNAVRVDVERWVLVNPDTGKTVEKIMENLRSDAA